MLSRLQLAILNKDRLLLWHLIGEGVMWGLVLRFRTRRSISPVSAWGALAGRFLSTLKVSSKSTPLL